MSLEDPVSRNNYEQNKELNDAERENLIQESSSFPELDTALRKIGWVKGGSENFSANVLIDKIQRVRKGELSLKHVTRTHGIRETVARLLESEKETRPKSPKPPREAAVALEIPMSEEDTEKIEEKEEEGPSDIPPSGAAGAEREKTLPESEGDSILDTESAGNEPPSEPTTEEYGFLNRWKRDGEMYRRGGHLVMGAQGLEVNWDAPERVKKIWEEEKSRYLALEEKLEKWQEYARSQQAPTNYAETAETREMEESRKKGDEELKSVRRRLKLRSMRLPGS